MNMPSPFISSEKMLAQPAQLSHLSPISFDENAYGNWNVSYKSDLYCGNRRRGQKLTYCHFCWGSSIRASIIDLDSRGLLPLRACVTFHTRLWLSKWIRRVVNLTPIEELIWWLRTYRKTQSGRLFIRPVRLFAVRQSRRRRVELRRANSTSTTDAHK